MIYLYHGIIFKNLKSMTKNGINPGSYWGTEAEAMQYTDCNRLVRIEPLKYTVLPNTTIIDAYVNQGCDDEDCLLSWEQSNKTWIDSLRIFGTVIVEERVFFDDENVFDYSK